MTTYRYRALTADGKTTSGSMEGADEKSVIDRLRDSGLLPISAEPAHRRGNGIAFLRQTRGPRRPIRRRAVTELTRELATLLAAGLPVDVGLRTLERHCRDAKLIRVVAEIRNAVQNGSSLSKAFGDQSCFDPFYVSLVRAGEASGTVGRVFEQLADYRERQDTFRRALVTSLTYPAVLAAVSLLSLFVLMTFVVPRFVLLFSEAGAALPVLTRAVFATAGFLQGWWWLLIGIGSGLALFGRHWYLLPANRRLLHAWLLAVPALGHLVRCIETARFTGALGSLLANGVPLPESMALSARVTRNEAYRAAVLRCRTAIEEGARLSEALNAEAADILPPFAQDLIGVGEESGKLDEMLRKTAASLEERTQSDLHRMLTVIEPATILGLGGAIAIVIVAILMAMLGLNDLIL